MHILEYYRQFASFKKHAFQTVDMSIRHGSPVQWYICIATGKETYW